MGATVPFFFVLSLVFVFLTAGGVCSVKQGIRSKNAAFIILAVIAFLIMISLVLIFGAAVTYM